VVASHSSSCHILLFVVLVLVVQFGCNLKISIMGSVRVINDDNHFQGEMSSSGTKLVVVDYTASW
jgi:hypothetical protein